MLCLVLLVVALAGGCRGEGDGSPLPPPAQAHLDALRRQLMRDNYDYQHSDDEHKHRNTTASTARQRSAKLYYQRGETDHLSRASELSQGNSKAVSSEHGQHEHYQQRAQQDRGRQHEQWREYKQSGEHEQLDQRAQRSQEGQWKQHAQRERGEQQEQLKQYEQLDMQEQQHAQHVVYKNSAESVRDQRGNYNDQYTQDDEGVSSKGQRQQELHALESDSLDSLNQEEGPDQQDTFDQQESSWPEDNKKQRAIYDKFGRHSQKRSLVTRTNRLQHHRSPPPHNVRNSQSYREDNASHEQYILRKDLPYYMSGNQLRRRNIVDRPNEDQSAEDEPAAAPLSADRSASSAGPRPSPTGVPALHRATSAPPGLPRTERTRRALFVTVSAANVTYELLTLKSRDGRRRGEQRFVEERGPEGVAIISLDEAPLPALRLPRSR